MTFANDTIEESIWKDTRFRLLKERVGKSAAMVVLLIQIGTILNQAGNSELFSPLGLSTERYELLFIVRDIPKQRPSDVAKYTLMHPAKVTREVDSLIDDGYIERVYNNKDRRSYYLILTDKGSILMDKADNAFKDMTTLYNNILVKLTHDKFMNMLYIMGKMIGMKIC